MEILLFIFALLFGGCLQSCAAPIEVNAGTKNAMENVVFTLPRWDNSVYPRLDYWEITEITICGKECSSDAETARKKTRLSKSEDSFSLSLKKNLVTSVSACPVTLNSEGERTLFFYPAGTVYPNLTVWDGKTLKNELTWQDGFTARTIETAYSSAESAGYSKNAAADFISRFNWKKFSDTIRSKENNSLQSENEDCVFYNPWQIDLSAMIPKLLAKKFTSAAMNPKNVIPYKTESPYPLSPYIPENNFIEQTKTLAICKNGVNSFLCGTDYLLLINASNEKKVLTEVIFIPKMIVEEY